MAGEVLADPILERIIVTDSVGISPEIAQALKERLVVVSAVPLFAEAIRRLHQGGSLVELLGA
jgi:ribose-phosphate pyrophosphokinase